MTMQVCVCGWYFDKFDDFYMVMHRVNDKYPVFVVANRESNYLATMGLPYTIRENTGLEWGAYNYFLQNQWDGKSSVLFTHDDVVFNPYVIGGEIRPPETLFDNLAQMEVDQVYIFSSRAEDVHNYSRHGRMLWMSPAFLAKAKDMGGFWYDHKNRGYTEGSRPELKTEMGCFGYNAGIIAFHAQAHNIGGKVHLRAYVPAFGLGVRGENPVDTVKYGQFLSQASTLAEQAKHKLHLGCGSNHIDGFVNVDLHAPEADVRADVRRLPFESNSFDWVESHHLIEHLDAADAVPALTEWHRVMMSGGHMMVSCPDLIACVMTLKDVQDNQNLWDGFVRAVYGLPQPGMRHMCGYSAASLSRIMTQAGFCDVEVKSVIGYRPTPSLIGIGRKE